MVGSGWVPLRRAAGICRPDPPGSPADGERAANSIDRYSLALQLIQVFPIVSEVAVVLVTTTWLARILSAVGLFAGTAWVVRLERVRMAGRSRRPPDELPLEETVTVVPDEMIRRLGGVLLTELGGGEYGELGEISISIRLRPAPSLARHRERRLRRRRIRDRPEAVAEMGRISTRPAVTRNPSPVRNMPLDC